MTELYREDGKEKTGNPLENPCPVIKFQMFVDIKVELFVFSP